jgi:putative colanic acid biosynthesis UDP-glucose lipid carrier transferase
VNSRRLRAYEDFFQAFQRIVDIVCIVFAHALACAMYGTPWRREMGNATVLAIVVFSIITELTGVYRQPNDEPNMTARPVLGAWVVTAAVLLIALFATKTSSQFSRVISFGWLIGAGLTLVGWRVVGRTALGSLWASGRASRPAAILGATASGERLCQQIRERPWLGIEMVGVYDDRDAERRHSFTTTPCRHVGGTDALIEACRTGRVEVVYVALPLRAEARIAELMRALANTTATVYLIADFLSYDLLCARFSSVGNSPLISVHDTPFQGTSAWLKRVEDIIAGLAILMVIAIPLLIIAVLVKLSSPGPVLFRQRRYGLNGKEIRILKFRTMSVCEDGPQIAQAVRNDPRVTRLGKFLRRTSLDELPQFLQVLTGEMSIVGPRPHAVAHNEQYRSLIPGYMLRHKVKPGITGWAQVNGWRGETPTIRWMKKRVEHDLDYIENWSFFWDLKIILMTIVGRKKSRNAY